MDLNKPMSILLIEDDIQECTKFENYAKNRNDIRIVGITNSSDEGINLVKNHLPEVVILDLELHKGTGSGLNFLNELQEIKINLRPFIIVTTNVTSEIIFTHARHHGADYVFSKKQVDYSIEMAINLALTLRKTNHSLSYKTSLNNNEKTNNIESPEELKNRIIEKIEIEMDLIGVPNNLRGRTYLIDGIHFLLTYDPKNKDTKNETVMEHLSRIHHRSGGSISRSILTAIRNTWERSPIEDLQLHYTDRIDHNTGLPTTTDFLTFYAKKIRKTI